MLTVNELTITAPKPRFTAIPYGDTNLIQRDGIALTVTEVLAELNRRGEKVEVVLPMLNDCDRNSESELERFIYNHQAQGMERNHWRASLAAAIAEAIEADRRGDDDTS